MPLLSHRAAQITNVLPSGATYQSLHLLMLFLQYMYQKQAHTPQADNNHSKK